MTQAFRCVLTLSYTPRCTMQVSDGSRMQENGGREEREVHAINHRIMLCHLRKTPKAMLADFRSKRPVALAMANGKSLLRLNPVYAGIHNFPRQNQNQGGYTIVWWMSRTDRFSKKLLGNFIMQERAPVSFFAFPGRPILAWLRLGFLEQIVSKSR